jgi:hypothetical protein
MKIFLCSFITVRGLRYILYEGREEGWMDGRKERRRGSICDFYVININVVMQLIFIEKGELHNNEQLTMCLSLQTKLLKQRSPLSM